MALMVASQGINGHQYTPIYVSIPTIVVVGRKNLHINRCAGCDAKVQDLARIMIYKYAASRIQASLSLTI
jgi:hypothetical protein